MRTSRIMNLRTGLTTCTTCGAQYSWDIQVCPACVARQEEAAAKQWSTDAEKAAQKAEGEVLAAALARDVLDDYNAYFDAIYGSELHESPRDWADMRGDLAV